MRQVVKKRWLFVLVAVWAWAALYPPRLFAAKRRAVARTAEVEAAWQSLSRLVVRGKHREALAWIQKRTKGKSSHADDAQRVQFLAAYLHLQAGQPDKAVKLLSELRGGYPVLDDYVDFYLAKALREDGQAKEAQAVLQALQARPLSAWLKQRVDRELSRQTQGASEESSDGEPPLPASFEACIARSDAYLAQNRPDLAVGILERAEAQYAIPLSLRRKLAETYFKARKYPEAARHYDALSREDPAAFTAEDQVQLARAYARGEQFDQALSLYRVLFEGETDPEKKAEYLYRIAFIYEDKGEIGQANRLYSDWLDAFPKHGRKEQILWKIAWNQYALGEIGAALDSLDALEQAFPRTPLRERLAYWRARMLERQGKLGEAHLVYRRLAEDDAHTYYALLAAKRLERKREDVRLPPQKQRRQGLPRLARPVVGVRPRADSGHPELLRLEELLKLGLWEDFAGELRAANGNLQSNILLSGLQREIADKLPPVVLSDRGWGQKYPVAYPLLVSFLAETRQVSPALVWAVMREESGFRPRIVSQAQAIGLMQIIAPTGDEISRSLGREDFEADDLYQPWVNIEYGTEYLAMNLQRFDQNLIYAIASYNAGPEAVERWAKKNPQHEWDEFVEEIPYAETQEYVRKVLRAFYLYRLLYGL